MKRSTYINVVRITVLATVVLLITNAIFQLTQDVNYMFASMLSSAIGLIFAFIMHTSNYKYTWKEVFFIRKEIK